MEGVYENSYRKHAMGMPILGEIENIFNVTSDMVVDFWKRNYFGENIVIVGAGNIQLNKLSDLAWEHFNQMPS